MGEDVKKKRWKGGGCRGEDVEAPIVCSLKSVPS